MSFGKEADHIIDWNYFKCSSFKMQGLASAWKRRNGSVSITIEFGRKHVELFHNSPLLWNSGEQASFIIYYIHLLYNNKIHIQ